jgi:hypothetical protein
MIMPLPADVGGQSQRRTRRQIESINSCIIFTTRAMIRRRIWRFVVT